MRYGNCFTETILRSKTIPYITDFEGVIELYKFFFEIWGKTKVEVKFKQKFR